MIPWAKSSIPAAFFPEKYKIEAEKYLDEKTAEKRKELDTIIKKAENCYVNFTKKSYNELALNEYDNAIEKLEKELKAVDIELSSDLLKITDKNLMLPVGHVYANCAENYDKITRPYLKEADVDDSKLAEFHSYFEQKYEELKEYRIKVIYSISKEEAVENSSFNKKRRTRSYLVRPGKYSIFT